MPGKSTHWKKWLISGAIGVAALILGFVCFSVYSFLTPRAEFVVQPVTSSEFTNRFRHLHLPKSATNIYYASSSVSLAGRATLYRFDASVEDCVRYAQELIQENYRPEEWRDATNLTAIAEPSSPIEKEVLRSYGLEQVRWFDVENVSSGHAGRAPPYGLGQLWIDSERGRFYYYWTD